MDGGDRWRQKTGGPVGRTPRRMERHHGPSGREGRGDVCAPPTRERSRGEPTGPDTLPASSHPRGSVRLRATVRPPVFCCPLRTEGSKGLWADNNEKRVEGGRGQGRHDPRWCSLPPQTRCHSREKGPFPVYLGHFVRSRSVVLRVSEVRAGQSSVHLPRVPYLSSLKSGRYLNHSEAST